MKQIKHFLLKSLVILVVFALFSPAAVWAKAGSLDTSFGENGVYKGDFGSAGATVVKVIVEESGKTWIVGKEASGSILVRRLTSNGVVDSSFTTSGVLRLTSAVKNPVDAILFDGKLCILGEGGAADNINLAVICIQSNGRSDSSFGIGGVATVDFSIHRTSGVILFNDRPKALAQQISADGEAKLLLLSESVTASNWSSAAMIARLNPNGALDDSFAVEGKFVVMQGAFFIQPKKIIVDTENNILVAGDYSFADMADAAFLATAESRVREIVLAEGYITKERILEIFMEEVEFKNSLFLFRLGGNGSYISAFIDDLYLNGKSYHVVIGSSEEVPVLFDKTKNPVVHDLLIQDNGKILLVATVGGAGDRKAALVRFDDVGVPDAGFGSGGVLYDHDLITPDSADAKLFGLLQEDQKILIASEHQEGSETTLLLARYSNDGDVDRNFGSLGLAQYQFAEGTDRLASVALQGDTVLAASVGNGQHEVARFLLNEAIVEPPVCSSTSKSSGEVSSCVGPGGSTPIDNDQGGGGCQLNQNGESAVSFAAFWVALLFLTAIRLRHRSRA